MNPAVVGAYGNYDRIQFAAITDVNPNGGVVSIAFMDMYGKRDNIPIPVIAMSKDAWIRFIPQKEDVVIVGIRGDDSAHILGWHPFNYNVRTREFEKGSANAAAPEIGKEFCQALGPGQIDMKASGGGYLRLNNVGDVLLMSLAGRIQMFGIEGLTELSQHGLKITDGQSTLRFGAPFRHFPLISARELPTSGAGLPLPEASPLRERDTRLYDEKGDIVIQESLGNVIDADGVFELSGTSGAGKSQEITNNAKKASLKSIGSGAKEFLSGVSLSGVESKAGELIKNATTNLTQAVGNFTDHVQSTAKLLTTTVRTKIATVTTSPIATLYDADLGSVFDFVTGVATGTGPIGSILGSVSGIGQPGKALRYRLLINKKGSQVAAYDIDEDGQIVLSSENSDGISVNANKGSITMSALKGIKAFAGAIAYSALRLTLESTLGMELHAGGNFRTIAGGEMKLEANKQLRASNTTINDVAAGTITIESTTGAVNVTGATVGATGATVTLTGATGVLVVA